MRPFEPYFSIFGGIFFFFWKKIILPQKSENRAYMNYAGEDIFDLLVLVWSALGGADCTPPHSAGFLEA